jgi:AraC-like DNA-binding protein
MASGGGEKPPEIEPVLLRRLQQLMDVERAYRREGLTIGSLSAELGVPEYRLRQLINEGLGHRNFNAFLNRYRIEEAKAALADPEQREVPVLTIAMDAGFQSVGPFNRAFRAATDLTPTEFRRLAMAKDASMSPKESVGSGIGKPD